MISNRKIFWLTFMTFSLLGNTGLLMAKQTLQDSKKNFVVSVLQTVTKKLEEVTKLTSELIKIFDNWVTAQVESLEGGVSVFRHALFAFLAGLSVCFTPCIYPLIPITLGTLGAGGTAGVRRRLARAIAYFLGVSLVFATLGFLAIHFNWVFGTWLGNKWVVFGTVAVFAFLALTMLDLIDFEYSLAIKAPAVTSVFSALLYGMATGLIASPCMTPALLTLLGFVAQNNSAFLGFSLLFAFALGMTFPIILLSSFSNLLLFMPKPGSWMIEFRHLLGFGILFLCVSFLKPVTSSWQQHLALGLVWAFVFFYYFFSSKKESVARLIVAHQKRTSGIGIAEFISFGFFLKKALSIAALFFAIFYVGKSYLVYNRTKLKFVLMKLLR